MPKNQHDIIDYISHEETNLELFVCTRILKLDSLHFGYWENGEALTMENVRRAQQRYTEKLIGHIPETVHSVLDVGCGIGDVSRALAQKQFKVTALSPDREHKAYFKRPDLAAVRFYNKKFEDLDISDTFDLILMSESQNYFDRVEGFRQCTRYLKKGGYLLVCGMFKKNGNPDIFKYVGNREEDYIETAAHHGFKLCRHKDITPHVLPTMEFARTQFQEYVVPFIDAFNLYARGTSPVKQKLLRLVFRKELRRVRVIRKYYEEFFNPDLLRQHVRYATHLYEYQ